MTKEQVRVQYLPKNFPPTILSVSVSEIDENDVRIWVIVFIEFQQQIVEK
jgi:hypothetical protein